MKKFIYILSAMLVTAACADSPAEPEGRDDSCISLSVSSLSFLNTGEAVDGKASVTVESSGTWRLIGKDDWCHPSAKEGKDGETVTFTADPNAGSESRTATFSFVSGSKTAKLHVMQKFSNVIELYKDEFSLPREGGRIAVRASANTEVSVCIPDEYSSWIEQVPAPASKSLDLNVFYFNVKETDQYQERKGTISFISDDMEVTARISQERKIELSVEQSTFDVKPDGGTVEVIVRTNLPYSINVPDMTSSWLSHEPDPSAEEDPGNITSRTERFSIKPQGEMTRAGKITLTSLDGSLTVSFVIRQRGSKPKVIEIPDPNFRSALADISYVITDGYTAPQCELSDLGQNATEMDVSGKGIESIEGIKNFPAIESLNCSNNNITKVDFSGTKIWIDYYGKGSKLYGNPIEEFIGGPYTQYVMLEYSSSDPEKRGLIGANGKSSTKLRCSGDKISAVYVQYNASLAKLDLSGCPLISGSYSASVTGCTGGPDGKITVYLKTGAYISFPPENANFVIGSPVDW